MIQPLSVGCDRVWATKGGELALGIGKLPCGLAHLQEHVRTSQERTLWSSLGQCGPKGLKPGPLRPSGRRPRVTILRSGSSQGGDVDQARLCVGPTVFGRRRRHRHHRTPKISSSNWILPIRRAASIRQPCPFRPVSLTHEYGILPGRFRESHSAALMC